MTTSPTHAWPAEHLQRENLAPEWSRVPFDVACARCGHDLRGLTEPTCPGCALSFEWSEAVPVEKLSCAWCGYHLYGLSETRCPECGSEFEWSEALARYHRRRMPYFEYRWRDRPVWSLWGTWRRALLPSRFWRGINLHDPPRPGALLLMAAISLVFFYCVIVLGATVVDVSASIYGGLTYYAPRGIPFPTAAWFVDAVQALLDATVAKQTWACLALYGTWVMTSFASLLIFQQSMRRHRIRTPQIVRVWAYAVPMVAPGLFGLGVVIVSIEVAMKGRPSDPDVVLGVGLALLLADIIWSLRLAYRRYLGMDHAWAVALCSQVIALLSAILIFERAAPSAVFVSMFSLFGTGLNQW